MARPPTVQSIKQKSFSDLEYAAKKKLTRRDRLLAEIDKVAPWSQLHRLIASFYPNAEGAGRPPIGLARMLRLRCMWHSSV